MATPREELTHALKLLASSDEGQRLKGGGALIAAAGTPELDADVRTAALGLLTSDESQLRAAGVKALSTVGAPNLQASLERAARDDDPAVRREATKALGGLEERGALPALARALADEDAQVRFDAAVGLAALGDRSGVDVLLEAVDDKVRRFFALGALARLAEPRAQGPAEQILRKRFFISEFERAQAAGVLAKLGIEEGRAYLLSRLRARRADERGMVMELCGELKLAEAGPLLREAVMDPSELFRGTAARSLGLLRDVEFTASLIQLAKDPAVELEVRFDVMEGLMFLRTPEAVGALHAISSSGESTEVRDAANDALGWLQGHPETGS